MLSLIPYELAHKQVVNPSVPLLSQVKCKQATSFLFLIRYFLQSTNEKKTCSPVGRTMVVLRHRPHPCNVLRHPECSLISPQQRKMPTCTWNADQSYHARGAECESVELFAALVGVSLSSRPCLQMEEAILIMKQSFEAFSVS